MLFCKKLKEFNLLIFMESMELKEGEGYFNGKLCLLKMEINRKLCKGKGRRKIL